MNQLKTRHLDFSFGTFFLQNFYRILHMMFRKHCNCIMDHLTYLIPKELEKLAFGLMRKDDRKGVNINLNFGFIFLILKKLSRSSCAFQLVNGFFAIPFAENPKNFQEIFSDYQETKLKTQVIKIIWTHLRSSNPGTLPFPKCQFFKLFGYNLKERLHVIRETRRVS